MDKHRIDRINFLAHKARASSLTPEEQLEQQELRRQYVAEVRRNLAITLENTLIERPDGSREKLKKSRPI